MATLFCKQFGVRMMPAMCFFDAQAISRRPHGKSTVWQFGEVCFSVSFNKVSIVKRNMLRQATELEDRWETVVLHTQSIQVVH